MQNIISERPYQFVPPDHGTIWYRIIQRFNFFGMWLRRSEGVDSYECRNVDKLTDSLAAGHGVLLAPNHARQADPLAMGWLAKEANCQVFAMASSHLFNNGWFKGWAIRKMGGFSVNREGVDRQAIDAAIQILETAERPLIIFPEGAVSRTNDRLHALLDGVAFIARAAAKRRVKRGDGGKVVIHPVAVKYIYEGDIWLAVDDVLSEIEERLSWRPQRQLSMIDRLAKVGAALLSLKEIEYLGEPQGGGFADRLPRMMDRLLHPLEVEWLGERQSGPIVPRVKAVRMKLLPDMVNGLVDPDERARRWEHLADLYLAQQFSCYQPDYLVELPSVDRVLETVERFEEDLTDKARVHGKLRAIIDVGDPLEVQTKRDRNASVDPLMASLEQALQDKLRVLATESARVEMNKGHWPARPE